jgi:hypothetical protein
MYAEILPDLDFASATPENKILAKQPNSGDSTFHDIFRTRNDVPVVG